MARFAHIIWLVIATMHILSLYIVSSLTSHSASPYQYPSDSLACKMHGTSNMDCSHRNLFEIPVLEQNLTTILDLSHNRLQNITNAPFQNLRNLLILNLRSNELSLLSSTTFRGLKGLTELYLSQNKLVNLPKDVFLDLFNLLILKMDNNYFTVIPSNALEPLHSLQHFSFIIDGEISDTNFTGFQNIANLNTLAIFVVLKTNISNEIFLPFSRVPLQILSFSWYWTNGQFAIQNDVFAPFTNVIRLITSISSLPAIESLHSPLKYLSLVPASYPGFIDFVVNKTSLKVLQKWNSSLTFLAVNLVTLQRVEEFTFKWIPLILTLDLNQNEINYLAKNAFYGLTSLQKLLLNQNSLSAVPSKALEVFKNCASFQHLDLSSNKITSKIGNDAFSAVSSSLTYLNLKDNSLGRYKPTEWLNLFLKLEYLSLGDQNNFAGISIVVINPLLSLQSFVIHLVDTLYFEAPFCSLFPNSHTAIFNDAPINNFPSDLVLHKCLTLIELDLSGSIADINSLDLELSIDVSSLYTLKNGQKQTHISKTNFLH